MKINSRISFITKLVFASIFVAAILILSPESVYATTTSVDVGSSPGQLVVSGTETYVMNTGGTTVSVINTTNDSVTAITVGTNPYSATLVNSYLYVNNYLSDSISVINTGAGPTHNTVIYTINLATGSHPQYSTLVGSELFVSDTGTGKIDVIDVNAANVGTYNTVVHTVSGLSAPGRSILANNKLYVTEPGTGHIVIINTSAYTSSSISTGGSPQSFTLVGTKLYVNKVMSNTVSVIDTTNDSLATITVGTDAANSTLVGGRYLYVNNSGSSNISVIDTNTDTVIATISVSSPQYSTLVGTTLYVSGGSAVYSIETNSGSGSYNTITNTELISGGPTYSVFVSPKLYIANPMMDKIYIFDATPSADASVTSTTYSVSTLVASVGTITGVPNGTSKATFLGNINAGHVGQSRNETGINDPVLDGDVLVVTAQDGITTGTYTIAVLTQPTQSSDATLGSGKIKGTTLAVPSFGTPNADVSLTVPGTVTIYQANADDTSNMDPYITIFVPTDGGATVSAVYKYATGSTPNLKNDPVYANESVTDQDFFVVKITAEDGTILYYKLIVTVVLNLSSDATIASGTIKGTAVTDFGTPSTGGGVIAGSVTIYQTNAGDTSNAGPYVTIFAPTNGGATVSAVYKYATGSTPDLKNDSVYANEAITDQDFFVVKVTAEDGTILYYKLIVTVIADPVPVPSTVSAQRAFSSGGGSSHYDISINNSVIVPMNTLKVGMQGGDVKILQILLNSKMKLSNPLVVDGKFGRRTRLVIIQFQKMHNLVPDGVVGRKTREMMGK